MTPSPNDTIDIAVHIVDMDALADAAGDASAWLSARESAHWGGLRETLERSRFATGRAALRALIGAPGAAGEFSLNPNGKPFLPGRPHFSFADTGGVALIAIADAPVGIDIEAARDIAVPADWAERHPALAAMRRGRERDGDSASLRFLRAWTRLEALVKRDGGRLDRTLDIAKRFGSLRMDDPPELDHVADLDPGRGFIAACAGLGTPRVDLRHFDPSLLVLG